MAKRLEPRRRVYLWQLLRGVLFAEFVLFVTWSPTGYSYLSWVSEAQHFTALQAVAGIALLIIHIALLRIVFLSLNYPGITATLALLGSGLVGASRLGLIDLEAAQSRRWFWIFVASCVISTGLLWGSLQQRLSGERTVLKNPP